MARKNNNALFFTCMLIEYIGRTQKQRRWKVTDYLGMENIKRIYNYADVFHCEPIEKLRQNLQSNVIFRRANLTMYQYAGMQFRITGILEKYMRD